MDGGEVEVPGGEKGIIRAGGGRKAAVVAIQLDKRFHNRNMERTHMRTVQKHVPRKVGKCGDSASEGLNLTARLTERPIRKDLMVGQPNDQVFESPMAGDIPSA